MTDKKYIYQTKTKSGKVVSSRYPNINDLKVLTNYINKLSAERTFILYQGQKISVKDEEKYLKSVLEKIKNKKAVHLLAFIGSDLIGYSDIELRELSQDHIGNFGITVAKKYRGQGIGRILMEQIFKEVEKQIPKLKIVALSVLKSNKLAHQWYQRENFIEYGRLPQGIQRKNKLEEVIYMYKTIK